VKTRIALIFTTLLALLACNFASNILSATETVEGTPTTVIEPLVTDTATALPIQPCPVSAGEPKLDGTSSFEQMPANVLQYLNAGGDLEDLVASLEAVGLVNIISPQLIEKDFTGDGYLDVVFILLDPEPEFMMPSGTLILHRCQSDHYEVAYQSAITEEVSVPIIYSTADLNSDALNDLLVGHQSCGTHTCFERLEVLSWNGATLENLMGGSSEDMPNPTIEVLPEETEILVTAQGIGSVGAGPFRRFTRRWTWDPGTGSFLPAPDLFLPSPFRIHLLHDADQAVRDSEYNQALEFYSFVIEDDELQGWGDPAAEREILGAYASFRIIHTQLLEADLNSAEATYTALQINYPPGSLGYDFAQMAEAFWSDYQASNDLFSACLAAQSFATSHQETIIDTLYFGYANPTYTAENVCPAQD